MNSILLNNLLSMSSDDKNFYNTLINIDTKSFQKVKLNKNSSKNITSFYRKLNIFKEDFLKENNWEKKINDLPSDIQGALKSIGFVLVGDEWLTPREVSLYIYNVQREFEKNGYIYNPNNVPLKRTVGVWNDYSFKTLKHVALFMLEKMDIDRIKVDAEFMEMISDMGFKTPNFRTFASTLERFDKVRKINSFTFKLKNKSEPQIAIELFSVLKKSNFNFLNKYQFLIVVEAIINKYNLIEDEPYYILRDYFNDKKVFFTTGNQMSISLNKKWISMKSEDRLRNILKTPTFLTEVDLGLKLGLNEFALQNQRTIWASGDDFLFFDPRDGKHIKYLKKLFDQFPSIKTKTSFTLKEFRFFCEISDDDFLKRLSIHKNSSFLLRSVYKDTLQEFGSYPVKYIIEKEGTNEQFINADDWEDF